MNINIETSRIDELIAGYFAQGLEAADLTELHSWLTSSEDNKVYFLRMQEVWFSTVSANRKIRYNSEIAFQRFLARQVMSVEVLPSKQAIFNYSFLRFAAAIALVISIGIGGYWIGNVHTGYRLADVSIEAPFGSKTKLYLPDGTLVWLNAGSTIRYSQEFGVDDRSVSLQGEAYFEVKKNKDLPFDVKTADMTVRVLGTKFNFRNYSDELEACVTLLEGKVSLTSGIINSHEQFLSPNQHARFDKKTGKISIASVKAFHASEWTKGFLFFDEERLPDIAKELERSYNVKIFLVDDALQNYRFYGNFTRSDQTIEEVLDVLASTNKLAYSINGKEVHVSIR